MIGVEAPERREDFPSARVLMRNEGHFHEGGLAGEPVSDGAAEGAVAVVEDVEGGKGLGGEKLEFLGG